MSYHLSMDLPGAPPLNSADGMDWRRRRGHRIRWEQIVHYSCVAHKPDKPLHRARVRIVRCSSRQPDFDNLYSAAKFILDGLVQSKVILDDNPGVIGMPECVWEKAPPGKLHTLVEVWEEGK